MWLYDPSGGTNRVWLGAPRDGIAGLYLYDRQDRRRAALLVGGDGSPSVSLADPNGSTRAALSTLTDGSPSVSLADPTGRIRAALSTLADGSPSLSLYDRAGRMRARLGVSFKINDRTGVRSKSPEGTVVLFDARGNVIWQAPKR